jgi:D-alanyl-D-alanine carboxypeptidase-like protein
VSAGLNLADFHLAQRTSEMGFLAPRFRAAVDAAIAECRANGLNAVVFETFRSNELQAIYFTRGRTVRPPERPVTNASDNRFSWHGYGLAVDVIHRQLAWGADDAWFASVAEIFRRYDCKWGGDWVQRDLPHFQWASCKPSPSDQARLLLGTRGVQAVWDVVGANAPLAGGVP